MFDAKVLFINRYVSASFCFDLKLCAS